MSFSPSSFVIFQSLLPSSSSYPSYFSPPSPFFLQLFLLHLSPSFSLQPIPFPFFQLYQFLPPTPPLSPLSPPLPPSFSLSSNQNCFCVEMHPLRFSSQPLHLHYVQSPFPEKRIPLLLIFALST